MAFPLFYSHTPVLIQGMTGKEGMRMAEWMMHSGVSVVAGVTPGKGGGRVFDVPIFHSVQEARAKFPDVITSCVVVPAAHVFSAVEEAIMHGVTCVYILTEQVPVHDVIRLRALARAHGAILIGPSSVGYVQFPRFRLGFLGGEQVFHHIQEGDVGLISASGGMANEILMAFGRRGIGIRAAIALGGDRVNGCTMEEAVRAFEGRDNVQRIALFVEPGHAFVRALARGEISVQKPLALCLPGDGMELLPRGLPYGHTGTILGEEDGSLHQMREQLRARGYRCADSLEAFVEYFAPAVSVARTWSEEHLVRGTSVVRAMQEKDFISFAWFTWTGTWPDERTRSLLESCFVACVDHGSDPPSSAASIRLSGLGKPLAESVAAGIATFGSRHGHAGSLASQWLREAVASGISSEDFCARVLERKERLPGIGHRIYTRDPRADALLAQAKKCVRATPHGDYIQRVSETLSHQKGKALPVNIDGALGAIVADLGVDSELADALFTTARTVGLIYQARRARS